MHAENKIVQLLSGRETLAAAEEHTLARLANQYPYFGIAHFLLAKKARALQEGNSTLLHKAALHFPDTYWLQYKLGETVEEPRQPAPVPEAPQDTFTPRLHFDTTEPAPDEDAYPVEEGPEIAGSNHKLAQLLQEQAAIFHEPVDPATPLDIERIPLHAVDYFEAEGIRVTDNNDQLGVKVRKFTDWLKQTKRSVPYPADLGTDPEEESAVQQTAVHSNEPKDVVTESMAEILIHQGKLDKAADIYRKLSFLHPDKNAYFAAKIKALKNI
jgi:hypothetical protein